MKGLRLASARLDVPLGRFTDLCNRTIATTAVLLLVCSASDALAAQRAGPDDAPAPARPAPRPEGRETLRLSVTSDEGAGPRRLEALFALDTAASGRERVTVLSAHLGKPDAAGEPLVLAEDCRRAFGGGDVHLGSFDVPDADDLSDLVPPCVPEPLFGAATDLLAFLQVQQGALEGDELRQPGDVSVRPGFVVTWSRPGTPAARIATSRVTITLVEATDDAVVLHWRPEPLQLAILRSDTPAGGMLLRGVETLELEVRLARDGGLLSGRSLVDTVDFTATPTTSRELPAPGAPPPAGPSFTGRFERELLLEAVRGDGEAAHAATGAAGPVAAATTPAPSDREHALLAQQVQAAGLVVLGRIRAITDGRERDGGIGYTLFTDEVLLGEADRVVEFRSAGPHPVVFGIGDRVLVLLVGHEDDHLGHEWQLIGRAAADPGHRGHHRVPPVDDLLPAVRALLAARPASSEAPPGR